MGGGADPSGGGTGSQAVNHYATLAAPMEQHVEQQASVPSQTGQTASIADMLAAASDRVVERLGYEYSEAMDMYYCGNSGLYYDQVRENRGLIN